MNLNPIPNPYPNPNQAAQDFGKEVHKLLVHEVMHVLGFTHGKILES